MFPIITLTDEATYEASPIGQLITHITSFCDAALENYKTPKGAHLTPEQDYAKSLITIIHELCKETAAVLKAVQQDSMFDLSAHFLTLWFKRDRIKDFIKSGEKTLWEYIQEQLANEVAAQLKQLIKLKTADKDIESSLKQGLHAWVSKEIRKHGKKIKLLPHETLINIEEKILSLLELNKLTASDIEMHEPTASIAYCTINPEQLTKKLQKLSDQITSWQLVIVDSNTYQLSHLLSGLLSQLPKNNTHIIPFMPAAKVQTILQKAPKKLAQKLIQHKIFEESSIQELIHVIPLLINNHLVFKNPEQEDAAPYAQEYQQQIEQWEATKQQALARLLSEFNYTISEQPTFQGQALSEELLLIRKKLGQWTQELEQIKSLQKKLQKTSSEQVSLPAHYLKLETNTSSGYLEIALIPLGTDIESKINEHQHNLEIGVQCLTTSIESWTIEHTRIVIAEHQNEELAKRQKRVQSYQTTLESIEQKIMYANELLSKGLNVIEEPLQQVNPLLKDFGTFSSELTEIAKDMQEISQISATSKKMDTDKHLQNKLQALCLPVQQKITSLLAILPALTKRLHREKTHYTRNQQDPLSYATPILSEKKIAAMLEENTLKLREVVNEINELERSMPMDNQLLTTIINNIQDLEKTQKTQNKSAREQRERFIQETTELTSVASKFIKPEVKKNTFKHTRNALAYYGEIQESFVANLAEKHTTLEQDRTDYASEIAKWRGIGVSLGFDISGTETPQPQLQQKKSFTTKLSGTFKLSATKKSEAYQAINTHFSTETDEDGLDLCLKELGLDSAFIARWQDYKAKQMQIFTFDPRSQTYKDDAQTFQTKIQEKLFQLEKQKSQRELIEQEYNDLTTILQNMTTKKPEFELFLRELDEQQAAITDSLQKQEQHKDSIKKKIQEDNQQLLELHKEKQRYQTTIDINQSIIQLIPQISMWDQSAYQMPNFLVVNTEQDSKIYRFQEQEYQLELQKLVTLTNFQKQLNEIGQKIATDVSLQFYQATQQALLEKTSSQLNIFHEQLLESVSQSMELFSASNSPIDGSLLAIKQNCGQTLDNKDSSFPSMQQDLATLNASLQTLKKDRDTLHSFATQISQFKHQQANEAIAILSEEKVSRINHVIELSSQILRKISEQLLKATDAIVTFAPARSIAAENHAFYQANKQAFASLSTNYIATLDESAITHLVKNLSSEMDTNTFMACHQDLQNAILHTHRTLKEQQHVNERLIPIIQARESALDPLLQRLQNYLRTRQNNFWLKDNFSSKDKKRREEFVTNLCREISQYKNNGEAQHFSQLIQHIKNNIPNYPGTHLQPLLYEILYALQKLDPAMRPNLLNPLASAQESPKVIDRSDAILCLVNLRSQPQAKPRLDAFKEAMGVINQELILMEEYAPDNTEYQNLIKELHQLLDDFIYQTFDDTKSTCSPPTQQQIDDFQTRFRVALHHKDISMQQHRQRGKQVAMHCFFGITTLGIMPSIQLIRSKNQQGYVSLITTHRQKLIQNLDDVFQETIAQFIAAQNDENRVTQSATF